MLKLSTTNKFRKDYKLAKKRGLDLNLLQAVIDELLAFGTLNGKFSDHALRGDYAGFRECHIQPDWLLINKLRTLIFYSTPPGCGMGGVSHNGGDLRCDR